MRIFKIIVSLVFVAIALIILDKSMSGRQFQQKFGISDFPVGVEIKEYEFSGLGMDHHYLWKLTGDSSELEMLIRLLDGTYIEKQSSTVCLSLSEEQAPDWWPVVEIDNRLWRSEDSTLDLYGVPTTGFGVGCLFYRSSSNSVYILWYDT